MGLQEGLNVSEYVDTNLFAPKVFAHSDTGIAKIGISFLPSYSSQILSPLTKTLSPSSTNMAERKPTWNEVLDYKNLS